MQLGRGGMHIGMRGAGELELAAGLERNATGHLVIAQADGGAAIEEGLPAGARADPLKQGMDAAVALIGHGADRPFAIDVLLVLRPDAPFGFRLRPARHHLDEIGTRLDRGRKLLAGHGGSCN